MTINEKKEVLFRINNVQEEINRMERRMNKMQINNEDDEKRYDRLEQRQFEKVLYRNGMVDLMAMIGHPVQQEINMEEPGMGKWDFKDRWC